MRLPRRKTAPRYSVTTGGKNSWGYTGHHTPGRTTPTDLKGQMCLLGAREGGEPTIPDQTRLCSSDIINSEKLVQDAKLMGETVLIKGINGGTVECPMAEVSLEVGDKKEDCEVAHCQVYSLRKVWLLTHTCHSSMMSWPMVENKEGIKMAKLWEYLPGSSSWQNKVSKQNKHWSQHSQKPQWPHGMS